MIDLTKITVPTLVICGDKDPYLNMGRVKTSLDLLPDGSELQVIEGGYFHNDGSWVDENTLLITLIGTPQIVVYKIAKEVCTAFHQEDIRTVVKRAGLKRPKFSSYKRPEKKAHM